MTMTMIQVKMEEKSQPRTPNRHRGVILTPEGLARLEQAKSEAEDSENWGNRFTLETLSERTKLTTDTIMKVFACKSGVDINTLKKCFAAFNLTLEDTDYYQPWLLARPTVKDDQQLGDEFPDGQVPLNSRFYINHPSIEIECYQTILKPGALIRLKAPRRRGKTSVMARILHHASNHDCYPVYLSLGSVDKAFLQNLDKFLQWFCARVGLEVKLPNRITDYWDDLFGSKISCKMYFEEYILENLHQPLVLGIDDVDLLFQYPELADDFFALLRLWHEEAKNKEIWQKLRLVVAHSSEVYIPLNLNKSPFNVGLPVELPLFTAEQVQKLARCYGLTWTLEQVMSLMELVEGHPYLVRLGLYQIWKGKVTLDELLTISVQSPENIYYDHLQRQFLYLQQQDSNLLESFTQVILSKDPVELDWLQVFKLESLGLIKLQGTQVTSSCPLYQQYFYQQLTR
ncbi:conserved hypothetical protein [Rippkaea orientalis PCC 8801]|uniref:Serine/threonine protein kinase n=1 Tax=Rippkaea orientalis (strain PCC 8801 / RF-1) TaxID=41431 RepID=B7K4L2_RIPO1|nr:AAA-like domain-containing protein [Rippkaea orientalis]ACK65477.1 conserved hypothetical protein [Rippkaea orientalis PCC 8801]